MLSTVLFMHIQCVPQYGGNHVEAVSQCSNYCGCLWYCRGVSSSEEGDHDQLVNTMYMWYTENVLVGALSSVYT